MVCWNVFKTVNSSDISTAFALTVYFVLQQICSLDINIHVMKKYNWHNYTSDSLWKIWLVESIQSIHNSLWTWHDKWNICWRYCIYHVKFNVCLVTKPLGEFSSETKWLNASVSEDKLREKCIIKQLLNSIFAWYHELSKPRVCVICLSLRLRQITWTSVLIIQDITLNLVQ